GRRDRAPHVLLHLVREVVLDVPTLVDLAALDHGSCAERDADGLGECPAALDHEEHRAIGPKTACNEIGEQTRAYCSILRRALVQAENVLSPCSSMPRAISTTCSPTWMPSIITARSARPARLRPIISASCSRVAATNRRLTALLLVPRAGKPG